MNPIADPATLFLRSLGANWQQLMDQAPPYSYPPVVATTPYAYLIRAIAHQHVHAKAAESLLQRLQQHFQGMPTPSDILNADTLSLRNCGFSARKIQALNDLAQYTVQGVVPEHAAALHLTDQQLQSQLTKIYGIGGWTVDMLLIFHLNRPDVLPVGDYSVREGYRRLYALPQPPTPKQLAVAGQAWSPYRTLAATWLWQAARHLPDPYALPK